ncbi:uncharacterized protein si:ch73-173p19.1 isoform X2 [Engraulis encrasicolus]
MGFSEAQIQAAMQAGHFSVPEAAEWLLQEGGGPRHKLMKQPGESTGTAFAAFNPPIAGPSTPNNPAKEGASLTLGQAPPPVPPVQTPPLELRIRQERSSFEDQQRLKVAEEARAERRQKKRERELVLKRIAEDRLIQQEKSQTEAASDTPCSSEQGNRLGGRIQTSVDNYCMLMIRLPSGESMRERFPADVPLCRVVEHIAARHPSLPSFSLLQGFPRRRFGDAELDCSLRSLGLVPNAALCIQATSPETSPPEPPSPVSRLAWRPPPEEPTLGPTPPAAAEPPPPPSPAADQRPIPQIPPPARDVAAAEEEHAPPGVPPLLPAQVWEEALGYAGIPAGGPRLSGPSHFWGRGHKLVPGDVEDGESSEDEEPPQMEPDPHFLLNGLPRLPFLPGDNHGRGQPGPRHRWPDHGNRLRGAEAAERAEEEEAAPLAPGAAGQAAVQRLERAGLQEEAGGAPQGHPSPPKRPFCMPAVPSLCVMATRATVTLMTAPSMQYSSSLAGLTPELAELLLGHMARERLLRPRTLELFFGCPLQKLVLNSYSYATNELLRQLRAFTALKHLSLVNSPLITDSGLSVLSSLSKLQYLNLSSCSKLTDCCLQYITGLKCLSFLALDQTKISDSGLVLYLRSAPSSLVQLSLNQTAITEATLAELPSCTPQLRLLSIKHTKVANVSALADLCSLQTLHLDGTSVREDSLQSLANHASLFVLSLAGIPVADGNHTLELIADLSLTQLTLPGRHSVTDSGLLFLSRLVMLSELDLTDYTQVTDQGVTHLAALTRLKKLSLCNTQVSDTGLLSLASLQELLDLCLDRCAVSSRGVARLITRLPHLQVLGLASTPVGDSVVRRGLIHCPELLKLNLSRTRITDHGLKFLRQTKLSQINLDGSGVTLVGVANLISCCPLLTSVRASHIRSIPPDQLSDDEGDVGAVH